MSHHIWEFRVLKGSSWPSRDGRRVVELRPDRWNDYGFGTTFRMFISSIEDDEPSDIGIVKIASLSMVSAEEGGVTTFTSLPSRFRQLPVDYVSVGQDASFYEELVSLFGFDDTKALLRSLRDLAALPELIEDVIDVDVVASSLLRNLGTATIRGEFAGILSGHAKVNRFELSYKFIRPDGSRGDPVTFAVERDSVPPTNIHALIGSNGAGKTSALRDLRRYFEDGPVPRSENYLAMSDASEIAGVVSISFSAFDTKSIGREQPKNPKYTVADVGFGGAENLDIQFEDAVRQCITDGPERTQRLSVALRFLESDQVLKDLDISNVDTILDRVPFAILSSGHKIVLLTVVNLVLLVNEKCLVLLDEPETHLHPPLLAALIRAVTWLMAEKNGIAIVATHSPVVLQEIPGRCAWKMTRSGTQSRIDPVDIETYGANLGVLTQEIFRLEMTRSGYYRLLLEAARGTNSFSEAEQLLGGSLGEEARLLLRALSRGDR